jgi:hypothetical protein
MRRILSTNKFRQYLNACSFAYKNFYSVGTGFLQLVNDVTGQNNLNPIASGSRFSLIVETKVGDRVCYIKGAKTQ